MCLKRRVIYTKHGSYIGFTGAKLPNTPKPNPNRIRIPLVDCGEVSWMARLFYRFGMNKLAQKI